MKPTEKDSQVVNTVLKWQLTAACLLALLFASIFAKVESGSDTNIKDLIRAELKEYKPSYLFSRSVALNTAYQPSLTRQLNVSVTCKIVCTASLTGGQDGIIEFKTSPDNITYTTVQSMECSNSVSLAIALTAVSSNQSPITAPVPAGYYYKLVFTQTTGTPTGTIVLPAEESSN